MPNKPPRENSPGSDQRGEERFKAAMPVEVDGSPGWTRDVSATGVYFEADMAKDVGSIVNLLLEVTISGEKFNLVCEGKVVRIDQTPGGKVGIAAQLRTSIFSNPEDSAPPGLHTVPAALDN